MANAPMLIKIILILLMCGVCGTLLVGLIGRDLMAFKIAGSLAVLAAILVVGWRVSQKSGGENG
jgi:hypothetical protein